MTPVRSASFLLEPAQFWFTSVFEAAYPTLLRELQNLPRDAFTLWPAKGAYYGAWRLFPFRVHCPPEETFEVDENRNCERCPDSAKLLLNMPRLLGATFARLGPGGGVLPHEDLPVPGLLRVHLGLRIPDDCELIVGGQVHSWTEGKLLAFDGQITHSVANHSEEPRDILIADMQLTPAEAQRAGLS